jgi:hypothetical protein
MQRWEKELLMVERSCVTPAIAALAGRRIDAQDANNSRFPLAEAEHVLHKLLRRFRQERIERIVCSAACGADILALEAAKELAIPAKIVLPFHPDIFRNISVTDRPGDWEERYDRLVRAARDRDDLIELGLDAGDEKAFTATNHRIIQEALNSEFQRKLAFVVWEGRSHGGDDSTAEFLSIALSHGFEKISVLTK